MPKFAKEVLCPGTYHQGRSRITISADDCRDFYLSLSQLRERGLHLPLILEHPPADRDPLKTNLGFPVEHPGELLADELKRTVGFSDLASTQTRLNSRGGVEIEFDVPDPGTAQQLADKRIRFVSPELLHYWKDGKGNEYRKLMSHVALTHRPVQIDQKAGFVQLSMADVPRGVLQLSMSELEAPLPIEPIAFEGIKPMAKKRLLNNAARLQLAALIGQFSSDENNFEDEDSGSNGGDNKPKKGADGGGGEDKNPDMPKTAGEGGDKQFEALIAHLTKLGLALPSDTDAGNLVDRLLTSVMTYNAVTDAADADDDADDQSDRGNTEELSAMGTAQMSSASARDKMVDRIRNCANMPSAIRDRLLVQVGTVQFSAAGAEVTPAGAMSIGELLSTYEREATQFSAGSPQSKIVDRLKKLKDAGNITPGIHDQLLAKVGRLQFSDAGAEQASGGMTMSEVLDQYEQGSNLVAGFLNPTAGQSYQFSGAGGGSSGNQEQKHPRGGSFLSGDQYLKAGDPKAVQLSSNMISRAGLKPRDASKRMIGINGSNLPPMETEED